MSGVHGQQKEKGHNSSELFKTHCWSSSKAWNIVVDTRIHLAESYRKNKHSYAPRPLRLNVLPVSRAKLSNVRQAISLLTKKKVLSSRDFHCQLKRNAAIAAFRGPRGRHLNEADTSVFARTRGVDLATSHGAQGRDDELVRSAFSSAASSPTSIRFSVGGKQFACHAPPVKSPILFKLF